MICTNCGSQVPDNQKFCTNCGVALQPAGQAERSSMSTNPQTSSKRNTRKMIIIIVIIVILALGGIGAATYFTHGFGLLDKKEETRQADSSSKSNSKDSSKSNSDSSSTSDTKKNEKDTKEKPKVEVNELSFGMAKVATTYKGDLSDVYAITGTIENLSDQYIVTSPAFLFKVSYTDAQGNKKDGDAILKSSLDAPDCIQIPGPKEDSGIFLAPHEKKQFTYYVNEFAPKENLDDQDIPNARFQIVTEKSSDNLIKLSPTENTITVTSVEIRTKECSLTPITTMKALSPDDVNLTISYSFDWYEASVVGNITNTTEDAWRTARIYYYTECNGHYLLRSNGQHKNINFLKPGKSEDFRGNAPYVMAPEARTYTIKPVAITYEIDNLS